MKKKSYLAEMITIVVVVAILVVLIVLMVRGSSKSSNKIIPDDYYDKYVAEGKIEKQYQKLGNIFYAEDKIELDGDDLTKICYYAPKDIGLDENKKYPVVIFVNNTDTTVEMYEGVLMHLVSYGFICVGCNDGKAYKGLSTKFVYDHLVETNSSEDEYLYNHIDLDNVGLYGHVYGAVGAIRAITEYNVPCKALVTVSMPQISYLAEQEFEYLYDVSKVNTSWFASGSSGEKEQEFNPIEEMEEMISNTPSQVVMAIRNGIDYGSSMGCVDGYATAYYSYILQQNEEANAFLEEGELTKNSLFSNFGRNY